VEFFHYLTKFFAGGVHDNHGHLALADIGLHLDLASDAGKDAFLAAHDECLVWSPGAARPVAALGEERNRVVESGAGGQPGYGLFLVSGTPHFRRDLLAR